MARIKHLPAECFPILVVLVPIGAWFLLQQFLSQGLTTLIVVAPTVAIISFKLLRDG